MPGQYCHLLLDFSVCITKEVRAPQVVLPPSDKLAMLLQTQVVLCIACMSGLDTCEWVPHACDES
jgi:hypothetical protein